MPTIQRLSREQYERGDFVARPGYIVIRISDPAQGFADVQHAGHRAEHHQSAKTKLHDQP